MSSVLTVMQKIWPILVALIPSIITALSVYPETAPEANVVSKVWDFVKYIMSYLSVATFKNQPELAQLPIIGALKTRTMKKLAKEAAMKAKGAGTGCAALLLIGFLSLGQTSCSWFNKDVKPVVVAAFDCAASDVVSELPNLVMTVLSILTNNASDVLDQLGALSSKFGEDVVACTVKAIADGTASPPTKPSNMGVEFDKASIKIAKPAADAVISEKKWVFKSLMTHAKNVAYLEAL